MDRISENLIQLSDQLDQAGNVKCSNAVDDLLKNRSLHKVAQYVGVIGYVLKQNRAMGNCVRKKRVASQASMQEVVMECLSEYQDGQSYGTNDWTSKYAEAIQQVPTKFASVHVDFLHAVVEENDLTSHIGRVKQAHSLLLEEKVENTFIKEVLAHLDALEKNLKEGDDDHRPFKVAAPIEGYEPEQRNNWSRFWSPSWSRRGKDKDAQYEMDNVLESVMNISSNAQQIRSNISRLKNVARTLQNRSLIDNINALSPSDWNQTTARIQNIGQVLSAMREQSPDDETIFQPAEILSDLSSSIKNVHDQMSRVQRNMYNLRLRDALKGRGNAPAATDEYSDLDRALNRLYTNPLDEKSLYYTQKLHGRLEDALNMRQTNEPEGYGDWADQPYGQTPEVPGVNPENPAEETQQLAPANSVEDTVQSIAQNFSQIADQDAINRFVQALNSVLPTDIGTDSRQTLNMLADALREQSAQPQVAPTNPGEGVQTNENTAQPTEPWTFGNVRYGDDDNDIMDMPGGANMPGGNPSTASNNLETLRKMADAVNQVDENLARVLNEYLQNVEEDLPEFPETCSILKDEATSRLKLTQKKGGEVVVNT